MQKADLEHTDKITVILENTGACNGLLFRAAYILPAHVQTKYQAKGRQADFFTTGDSWWDSSPD